MPKKKAKVNAKSKLNVVPNPKIPEKDDEPVAKVKKVKSPLSAADRKQFRDALEIRMRILKGDVSSLEAEGLRQTQDTSGELSSVPIHLADLGTDAFEQELTLGRMESESDELQEINEALERIKEGTFGICENCGKAIPKARLRAIPYATLCVHCQEKEDGV